MLLLFTLVAMLALFNPVAADDSDLESWYVYLGAGYANNTYPDETQTVIDELNDSPDIDLSHLPLALELGFYRPWGSKTLLGAAVSANVDKYEATDDVLDVEIDIHTDLYALSAMHFLTHAIGQGPFVRTDIGLARASYTLGVGIPQSQVEDTSDWGAGFLIGGGYGLPVLNGTRVLVNTNFSLQHVEDEQVKSIRLALNGLF